jgi:hypothetical protein
MMLTTTHPPALAEVRNVMYVTNAKLRFESGMEAEPDQHHGEIASSLQR